MADGGDHLGDTVVDVRVAGTAAYPEERYLAVVEDDELDDRHAATVAQHGLRQHIVMLPDQRMHIGEVLVAGCRRAGEPPPAGRQIPRVFDPPRYLMSRRRRLWRGFGNGVGLWRIGFRRRQRPRPPPHLLRHRNRPTCCSRSRGSGGRRSSFPSSRRKRGPIGPWAPSGACPRAGPKPDPWAGEAKKSAGSRLASGDRSTVMPRTGSRRSSSVVPNTCCHHPAASPARASQAASSSKVTPSAAAFVAFEPGSAPATT